MKRFARIAIAFHRLDALTEPVACDIRQVKNYDEEGQRIFSTTMRRKTDLHLDDLAKSAKVFSGNDVHGVPEDIDRPRHLAASLSVDGNAVICDEVELAGAGSKRATCGSGGTAAAPTDGFLSEATQA